MNKKILRERILKERKREKLKDESIWKFLLPLSKEFKKVAIYSVIKEEPNLDAYWKSLALDIYLPIFKENGFSKYTGDNQLVLSSFGILEPSGPLADINELDAVIIPCVGVDKNGARLGYGSAFYDRVLAEFKGYKIGVCYNDFFLDIDFAEAHDIKLDILVTEKRVIKFGE